MLSAKVHARVSLPLKTLELPLDVRIEAEPIVSAGYTVKLQSVDVHVTSSDTRLVLADKVAGVYASVADPIAAKLKDFAFDLRPLLAEANARVAHPIVLPVGDAIACARLRVLEVEAGPTVLADGIEKDLALVVAPSITMPCDAPSPAEGGGLADERPRDLPPLSQRGVALQSGPFTVTVPIVARYDELTRAMSAAFTDGKLFFSKEYPQLFLEKPEVYESGGQLVLSLHIAGPVHKLGIDVDLDGHLYLTGHPTVVDNELTVPDLEPTIETQSFLLSLKAMTDGASIREQARQALRLDVGERLRQARGLLGDGLTFGGDKGCLHGDVDRVEVRGVYPHAAYLRVYVAITARARATVPCAEGRSAAPVP